MAPANNPIDRPIQATAAHISIVGHVTQRELAQHLSRTESHNGFANHCLWTSVRRSKSLPGGCSLPPEAALARELRRALDWAHNQTALVFRRTAAVRELWNGQIARSRQFYASTVTCDSCAVRIVVHRLLEVAFPVPD
jgi:hypothetical protein